MTDLRESPAVARPPLAADEEELLARARRGDRTAAELLVEATYERVHALLRRLTGDADRAADLTQETYRKAWAALPEFRGESRVSTWLHRIAYTTFLKSLRPSLRLVSPPAADGPDEPAPDPPEPAPGPEADADAAERGERLRRAVATLPEPLRAAVTAHYWSDIPVLEIARAEGITPVAVRKRLARAFRLLAVQLQEISR
jgi:RNA polymerase sigma-70 factor (ECF subfamily)